MCFRLYDVAVQESVRFYARRHLDLWSVEMKKIRTKVWLSEPTYPINGLARSENDLE